eukprot:TCONS_00048789-protein
MKQPEESQQETGKSRKMKYLESLQQKEQTLEKKVMHATTTTGETTDVESTDEESSDKEPINVKSTDDEHSDNETMTDILYDSYPSKGSSKVVFNMLLLYYKFSCNLRHLIFTVKSNIVKYNFLS